MKPKSVDTNIHRRNIRKIRKLRHFVGVSLIVGSCHKHSPRLADISFLKRIAHSQISVSLCENRLALSQIVRVKIVFTDQPVPQRTGSGVVIQILHAVGFPFLYFRMRKISVFSYFLSL